MMNRPAAALLLSCIALAGCTFDATGFGDHPTPSPGTTTTTTEPSTTTTTDSAATESPTSTGPGDQCGNYQKDPGEECDVGPNGNGVCTPSCTYNVCGDNYVGSGEHCDGDVPDCVDCKLASCGNRTVDPGEECDDGNADETDGCLSTCKLAKCGDGIVHAGVEQCDDANDLDTDACVDGCKNATCGDGLVWSGVEHCDDGNSVDTDECPNTCAAPGCGDGTKSPNEECDDGNTASDDGCSPTCKVEGCGDNVVQAGEECDNGSQNSDNAACTVECKNNTCGDGLHHLGVEQCDDGNTNNEDGCTNNCKTPVCGDGIVSTGEECDDGNDDNSDNCTNECKNAFCGDGIVNADEQCDDANDSELDACRNDCTLNVCGDGLLNPAVEDCDHGPLNNNNVSNGACSTQCKHNAFLVFVSSQLYQPKAEFETIEDADALCAELASSDAGGLKIKGGRWKAWLGDGAAGPGMNFHQSAIRYVTLQGGTTKKIADNWADLVDGDLDAAIDVTDTDTVVSTGPGEDCDQQFRVWTGLEVNEGAVVLSPDHCLAWKSEAMTNEARAGTVKQFDHNWTDGCTVTCEKDARLYCFEQPKQ